MKLQKILARLQKLHPKEIDLSLDRILNLCKKLNNPQDKIKAISVVGTNGKYSTIQAMYAILKEAKINCNIFTSPHTGIRFNSKLNDQKRVLTPKQAYKNGSDWLVIGRPITKGNIKKNIEKLIDHLEK